MSRNAVVWSLCVSAGLFVASIEGGAQQISLDAFYRRTFVRVGHAFAVALRWMDENIVDGVVNAVGLLVTQSAALPQSRERTSVLACWMVARLALPRLPRESDFSDADALLLRAEATRRWLAAQSLPLEVGLAASRACACDLAADKEPSQLADAIDALRDAADAVLNNSARAELTTLARLLRRSSLAAMR